MAAISSDAQDALVLAQERDATFAPARSVTSLLNAPCDEGRLDFALRHMGRLAFMTIVFLVAAVDDPAVLVRGVPNLDSEEAAAHAALNFAGENAHTAVSASLPLAPRHLRLHHLEGFRGDDGSVALLHEVTGNLPDVFHHLLREEVRRECLLDAGAAHVLLVGEDSVDGGDIPLGSPRGGGGMFDAAHKKSAEIREIFEPACSLFVGIE